MSNEPDGLPRPLLAGLVLLAIGLLGAGILLALGRPALRQAQLLDAAIEQCREREADAKAWLARNPERSQALSEARTRLDARAERLLSPDRGLQATDELRASALAAGFAVDELVLGTARSGEALDIVAARLRVEGDRVELAPLLAHLYEQPQLVRLVSLDVEVPRFGSQPIRAELRWEYPAAPRRRAQGQVPSDRWAPPSAASPTYAASVAGANRKRWQSLQEASDRLRGLGGPLAEAARVDAVLEDLAEQERSIDRWVSAGEAERRAVLRKLPALLQSLDASATGKANLRPGPGGTLRVEEE
jgi:hypothetical protein